jgi:demethylmenaquinone methyltransferase/2-methoxy-6-polyprenyl-1,4-benzoquinol methylase
LLDIGGGTGRISIHFSGISSRTIVADSALKMLKEAHKKGLSTIQTNSEMLPFCSGCFDRIIIVDAFHHVADQRQTLDEIWRTLAPGGRLVIEEPDIHNGVVKLIALGEKLLLMRSKFIKPQDIKAMGWYDDAKDIRIISENGIAWVIFEKN